MSVFFECACQDQSFSDSRQRLRLASCTLHSGRGFQWTHNGSLRSLYKTFLGITKQKFIIDMLKFARGVMVAATGKCWLCMNLQAQLSAIILKSHKVDDEAIYCLDFLLPYFCNLNAWCLALLAPYQCDFMHCLCTKCSVNFKFPTMTLSLAWGRAASATQILKHAPCKINTVSPGLTNPGLKHIVVLPLFSATWLQ